MDNHLVLDLDPTLRERLEQRAREHGRSLDDEVQAILVDVTGGVPTKPAGQPGLGTRIAALFSGSGYGFRSGEIQELRGGNWQVPDYSK
ncbi:FitA-like ribbon-helix-helix domain-containing protein [Niveispirillum sp. KHB5.9]|uniref:FitA-like ribbon-helix-helix domain-containing protein n=1 Tax=Niveispirillum sp. KHB5.9 TaxID=3400269 RepID=UPI003A8715FC